MSRHTAESLAISAIINLQDGTAHEGYGLLPRHFHGYRQEFEWVLSYVRRYQTTPSWDEFLVTFPEFPDSPEHTEVRWAAAEIIREHGARELSRALLRASGDLKAGRVEDAYETLAGLSLPTAASKPTDMLIDRTFLDDYDVPEESIPVPWKTLQKVTNGIGVGSLWYFAARPGQGKTTTMLDMVVTAALAGYRVLVYSLEMTKRQVQTRAHAIMAHELRIPISQRDLQSRVYDKLEYQKLLDQIESRVKDVTGCLHVHTPADGIVTPQTIAANVESYDLIVVDYVGLMYTDAGVQAVDDWRELSKISNALKTIALAHNVAILAASQINREGESLSGRPPRLKNLAGSDALGQDADVVITMAQMAQSALALSVEKNRHGVTGTKFWLHYNPDAGDIHEIDQETAEELRYETVDR